MRFHISIYCVYNHAVLQTALYQIKRGKLERFVQSAIANRSYTNK